MNVCTKGCDPFAMWRCDNRLQVAQLKKKKPPEGGFPSVVGASARSVGADQKRMIAPIMTACQSSIAFDLTAPTEVPVADSFMSAEALR